MNRVYNFPSGSAPQPHLGTPTSAANVRPFLPSFVGPEQFRSSPSDFNEGQYEQSQVGRLKEDALLSSLSFLPDDFEGSDNSDSVSQQQQENNSSAYHNPRYDPFNPRYAVSIVINIFIIINKKYVINIKTFIIF